MCLVCGIPHDGLMTCQDPLLQISPVPQPIFLEDQAAKTEKGVRLCILMRAVSIPQHSRS